ncbi:hypothetical protein [Sphingomonas bacterium]|uniref:hypothetical protein n=1 Tax=Sphingomonas bacterium TaxID=1895847 RepID=UPI0015762448|nr:hypothetical protein [Sphingomonas bacterium]
MGWRGGWLADFEIRGGTVRVRKTGATARIDGGIVREVAIWLVYYLCITARAAWLRHKRATITLGFTPDLPRPWYLIRAACTWARIAVTTDLTKADCAFFFEDATWCAPQPQPGDLPCLNFACTDISKGHVAAVFETIFGYPLALDPATSTGLAVEKSEVNARHDGRLVQCPCAPREGFVYQKLVDTTDGSHVHDLRTPCVAGAPVVVWEKLRRERDRFSAHNAKVVARDPAMVFSEGERCAIRRFCAAIGLDWGGLDILRDRHDGRIYIVDVNKTDAGPVIDLPLREKLRSTALLAGALRALLIERRPGACRQAARDAVPSSA